MKSVLCDIEGTTTSIAFAKDVLFPLSYREIESFIHQNRQNLSVKKEMEAVKEIITKKNSAAEPTEDAIIDTLKTWIRDDRKITPLKTLQGMIWKESFESGKIRGHVYPDVLPAFQKWNEQGILINIFSSGSVEAQKLVFRFSEAGDLSRFISQYFDTTTGAKKEAASYKSIAEQIRVPPAEILFLSDVIEELDAANAAGLQVHHVVRDGISTTASKYKTISAFDQIND